MARRVVEVVEDDLTGGEADETVTFSLDGVSYEIDLNSANAEQLREALAPYLQVARRAGRVPVTNGRRGRGSTGKTDSAAIRAWAKAQGIAVNDRGRIPGEVVAAFEAAS